MSEKRIWVKVVGAGVLAAAGIGAVGLAAVMAFGNWLNRPMPQGAAVDGYDLSGKTYLQARRELKTLQPREVTVYLPGGFFAFPAEGYKVSIDYAGALAEAGKTGQDVSLRPYLKVDEAALKQELAEYAAQWESTYAEPAWKLVGKAPDLHTDVFDPEGPEKQWVQVEMGRPDAHLDVENTLQLVLDAFARPASLPSGEVTTQLVIDRAANLPDWEAIAQEVYIEPVNDEPDPETGGIRPGSYGQSIDLSACSEASPEATQVSIQLCYTAPERMGEDSFFRDVLGSCETKHNTNENRNNNLRLLCQALDGHIVQPGETFSYNEVVGERTTERGYLPAPAYSSGYRLVDSVGGGVCQGSTTLYTCVLLADMEVVFRACHGAPVTYVPAGLDAAVNYLTTDFKFRNQYHFPVKIKAEVADGFVKMQLVGIDEKDYYVKMETRSGDDEIATYARSYRCKYDKKTDELLSREIEAFSTYYKQIS